MFLVEQQAGSLVVSPRCDLDLQSREAFRSALEEAGSKTSGRLIVSLLQCEYADSTALNEIARSYRKIGNKLALVLDPLAAASRVFGIMGFSRSIAIYPTIEAALVPLVV
jgi:anti-anti-sigma factor